MKWLIRVLALLAAGAFTARQVAQTRRQPGEKKPTEGVPQETSTSSAHRLPRLLRHFLLFFALLAVGGVLLSASGLVPIKASSGHWALTRWFLSFSMHRSVATHTLGLKAPALDDERLVLQGAGHYETGCRPCHGSPDLHHPRVAAEMTPHPPYLPPEIDRWTPEELFYIVKHGVKFTGMPAWPVQQRDDEVWAMVAFLLRLPELDAAAYRRLAQGEATARADAPLRSLLGPEEAPRAVEESCGRCHGVDGNGRGTGAFPRLAGQRPSYLYAALQAYARGDRHSGIMAPVAAGLSPEEMRALAEYYAGRPALPPARAAAAEAIARGRRIAHEGVPAQRIPSCADCHGPNPIRRNPFYPTLAGQYAIYLVQQLELFQRGQRGGSAYAHLMHPTADRLTPEQMRDVAAYYASLASGAE